MESELPNIGIQPDARHRLATSSLFARCSIRSAPSWLVSLIVHLGGLLVLAFTTFAVSQVGSKELLSWQQAHDEYDSELIDFTSPLDTIPATRSDLSSVAEPMADAVVDLTDALEPEPYGDGDKLTLPTSISAAMLRGGNRELDQQPAANSRSAEFYGIRAEGNTFVFIVDRSKSMAGERLAEAKKELLYAVRRLSPEQRFYVIFFAGQTEFMRLHGGPFPEPAPIAATEANIAKLQTWVDAVQYEPWTNPFEAVEFALKVAPDAIFLLSDGEFTDNGRTMRYLKNRNITKPSGEPRRPRIVIHSIAFHSRDGEPALKAIASDSGGTYRFVPPPHIVVRRR